MNDNVDDDDGGGDDDNDGDDGDDGDDGGNDDMEVYSNVTLLVSLTWESTEVNL